MPNWYYVRSDIDGKPTWIKRSGCPSDLPQADQDVNVKSEMEPPGAAITLDPKDFERGDIVEVTHHPPVDIKNCIPLEVLLEQLKDIPMGKFRPWVYFNSVAGGGMIEVVWKDEAYYVDYDDATYGRVPHLAYCKSFEKDEIVGIKLDNIARLKLRSNPE